jgi:hypothetical protein
MEAVEAEDLSVKEFMVEDDESSIEPRPSPEVGGTLGEGRTSSGGRTWWTFGCWLRGRFLRLLSGHSFWSVMGPFSFPLARRLLRHYAISK